MSRLHGTIRWKKIQDYGRSPDPQAVRIIGGSFKPLELRTSERPDGDA